MLSFMIRVHKKLVKKWIQKLPNDNVIKAIYLILTADVSRDAAKNSSGWSVLTARRSGQFGHQAVVK